MKKGQITVEGMHCMSCARRVEGILEDEGVTAKVNFEKGKAEIAYDESKISLNQIIKVVRSEGYGATKLK